jgi:hypothetical protein
MNSLRERVASASSSAARSKTGFFFLPGAESQSAEEKQNVVPRVVVTDPRGARRPTRVGARALEPRARRLRSVSKKGPSVGSSRRGQARAEAPEVACRRHPSAAADAPRRRDDRSTRVTCAIVAASGPIALASLAAGWPQSRAARERPRTRPRDRERTSLEDCDPVASPWRLLTRRSTRCGVITTCSAWSATPRTPI